MFCSFFLFLTFYKEITDDIKVKKYKVINDRLYCLTKWIIFLPLENSIENNNNNSPREFNF